MTRVLILANEPVVAALLGILVELAGKRPVFAEADETPTGAMERLRPLAVVLVEVSVSALQSDLFFAVAARHRIGVVVFGPETSARAIAETARTRRIPWFTVPPSASDLSRALDAAAGGGRTTRTGERRESSETITAADGTRILHDRSGNRWMIYDRRVSADRRTSTAESDTIRVFVSDEGELREYGLLPGELGEATSDALERQLARATI